MIRTLYKILSVIFPLNCLGCNQSGLLVCEKCLNSIDSLEFQECPGCRRRSVRGIFCGEKCRQRLFADGCCFNQLIVCSRYDKNGLLKKIIERFKYKFTEELSGVLSGMIVLQAEKLFKKNDQDSAKMAVETWIVPVPLHKKRRKERGYNQAELLSLGLVDSFGWKIVRLLKRTFYTQPQAHLSRKERLKNLKDAFVLRKGVDGSFLAGKRIVLTDDVCTTGSTLNECAKVLKKAGAEEIVALVLARGDGR